MRSIYGVQSSECTDGQTRSIIVTLSPSLHSMTGSAKDLRKAQGVLVKEEDVSRGQKIGVDSHLGRHS